MKTAYLDCFSGISGDMFLGALLDAGLPSETLKRAISTLPLEGYEIKTAHEKRHEISGIKFTVDVDHEKHSHRGLNEIKDIIDNSELSEEVKENSLSVFKSIAIEEGHIHGQPPENVHFHEVGAVDSIIDIVGTLFGLEYLKIGSVFASKLPLGSGFIESRHGRIPIPAPATLALLKGIPVYDSGLKTELTTPTGAALVKKVVKNFGTMPPMIVDSIGYGIGSRELDDRPNLFRIIIGKEEEEADSDTVVVLEANMDDCNPEWSGFLMDKLFQLGALDVVFYPVQMKKNRPGTQIQVIGRPENLDDFMEILFRESSSLGIRFRYSQRRILKRSEVEIESPWGKMKVKKVIQGDGKTVFLPEYEVCRNIAEKKDIPLREIYYWINSLNKV